MAGVPAARGGLAAAPPTCRPTLGPSLLASLQVAAPCRAMPVQAAVIVSGRDGLSH